ncbi:arylsulfatase B-like [Amblyomma americanum]
MRQASKNGNGSKRQVRIKEFPAHMGEASNHSANHNDTTDAEACGLPDRATGRLCCAEWLSGFSSPETHSLPPAAAKTSRPHIVFILVDDLGWADTSLHGSTQIPTPNLDSLASTGVLLNNYYPQLLCTPSRPTLMAGLYPIHHGLHDALVGAPEGGLALDFKIMPQHFKNLGYETHLVGKWHLGYKSISYTPTRRGFDSFFGYHNGFNDYYDHILESKGHRGLDFWYNTQPLGMEDGNYTTTRLTEQAVSVIKGRNTSKPLFLLMAHQATHSACEPHVLQAPEENVAKFSYKGDPKRTIYAGMVDALDQSVGALFEALHETGMLEDTVLVFSSDNGGHPYGSGEPRPNSGFNWPLRGSKLTLWEGGIRCAAFVWSPLLKNSPRVSSQLMHISDWLPTLFSVAGGDVQALGPLDGVDMWHALSEGVASSRKELLHDIDREKRYAALRHGDYKLVIGSYGDPWDNRSQVVGRNRPRDDLDELQSRSRTAAVLRRFYGDQRLFEQGGEENWRRIATVNCGSSGGATATSNFAAGQPYYLFNLAEDPCELHNLANESFSVLSSMLKKLSLYNETTVPAVSNDPDPRGFPENNNNIWMPWVSEEA